MDPQPWKCECGRLNGKNARYCGSCDWGYAPMPDQWDWHSSRWKSSSKWENRQWVKQPRTRTPSQHPTTPKQRSDTPRREKTPNREDAEENAKKKNRRKAKKAKQKEDQSYFSEPTWESSVPEIPSVTGPSTSSASATDAEARAELKAELAEKKYKELLRKLKQTPDALTPDVQEIVTKETVQETQSSAKSLHSAVSKMERAQKALDAAQGARLQLHSRWRTFVTAAVPRWTKGAEDFQQSDKDLSDKITAAKKMLESVREEYEQQNAQFGLRAVKPEVEVISDDEGKMEGAAQRVHQSVNGMLTSLEKIKATADELHEEEQKAVKRPRTERSASPSQMETGSHFAMPGGAGP